MVIVWPINLNVSCKLHMYSLQRTWPPPGPCLPKRIGNMHPHNYYNNVDWWFSSRVLTLHSVVAGSISSGRDHDIYCWRDLIRSKQLSSVSVCCAQVFAGFSGHGNSIHNIICLLKKKQHLIHNSKLITNKSEQRR